MEAGVKKAQAKEGNCDRCNSKFAIKLAYGPHKFCEKHFTQFFEARFKKTVRKYKLLKSHEKVLIALSGKKTVIFLPSAV